MKYTNSFSPVVLKFLLIFLFDNPDGLRIHLITCQAGFLGSPTMPLHSFDLSAVQGCLYFYIYTPHSTPVILQNED